jgi:hypothetical protein
MELKIKWHYINSGAEKLTCSLCGKIIDIDGIYLVENKIFKSYHLECAKNYSKIIFLKS